MNYLEKPKGTYHTDPKWYEARNAQLYEDKRSGRFSNAELITKYNLSLGRIGYIVNKERAKHEFKI